MVSSSSFFSVLSASLLTFAVSASAQTRAQQPETGEQIPLSKIPRVHRAPRLEDFLEGRPREAELTVQDFRQYIPGDGTPATEPTTAYLSYDDKNLYVAILCKDEPGQIRAHLSKREAYEQDDGIGLLLDTFRDFHRAYLFFSNPLGVQSDAIYTEGQGYDFSFDTLWYNSARLTKDGYLVFFTIPFKSLRFRDSPQQTWGIALHRVILRKSEEDYWPYVTQRLQGFTQQFAPVSGLENVSPGRNVQLIPYGLLASNHFLNQPSGGTPAFQDDFEHRAGLDAKFVVKDSLTFDVTVNPDFSQVESDDPQVTVNQRFAVFFPEKRPFFIENAGFFSTPINLFFSRQIADPQFGSRLTGKIGKWTLGALVIDDRQPGLGRTSGPFATRAVEGVARVTREFGKQSYVGAFASSRSFAGTHNRVVSLDARLALSKNWVADLQAVHTWTNQDTNFSQDCLSFSGLPGQSGAQQGNALYADLTYSGRHASFSTYYSDYSPYFCTELGFVNRIDLRQQSGYGGYFWRPANRKLIAIGPTAQETVDWNHAGVLQDWATALGFETDLTKQTTLTISRGEAMERFAGVDFRRHSMAVSAHTEPWNWLAFTTRVSTGIGINYFPSQAPLALPPFLGNSKHFNLGFTLRPSSRFRFDETYIYSRLGTRNGTTPAGFTPGESIFNNHLMRSKLNYQFTKELSLRVILDYNATLSNPGLLNLQSNLGNFDPSISAPSKRLAPDFLLTYLLHPGTALYVGYGNGFTDQELQPAGRGLGPRVVLNGGPDDSTNQLFFVKISYLLRY